MIIGDANLAEISTYLKVGTTSLVLAMIEDRFITTDLGIDGPVAALRAVSHDPTLRELIPMNDGRKLTALQLQGEYLELARKYVDDRLGVGRRRADRRRAGPLGVGAHPARSRTRCCAPASWTGWRSSSC